MWFDRARPAVLPVFAGLLTVVMLGPLFRRGYALSYDMVFAPRQHLLPETFGVGDVAPRSVPADAVVALLTFVVPGEVVQRVVLFGAVFAAAWGAGRLVPTSSVGVRLVAASAYAWTPYVAERLVIGHWPLLITYGVLPWIVSAGREYRDGGSGRVLARLFVLVAVGSLSAPGGLVVAGVVLVSVGRRWWWPVVGVVVVNATWWLPSVARGGVLSDPVGVAAFSARAESWGGVTVSLLGTGGIWNGDVVPRGRAGPWAPIVTVVVVGVALWGLRVLARRWSVSVARGLVVLGVFGVVVASLATLPGGAGLLRWAMVEVPGAGLLRDAQKWVIWWALPLALGFALGVEVLVRSVGGRVGGVGVVVAVVFPLVVVPDLAWGAAGRIEPVRYPAEWGVVYDVLADSGRAGDVLVLPLSGYRGFGWNEERTQFDPASRALPRTALIDDTLRVGAVAVRGENVRMARVREVSGAAGLSGLGVGWVLVEHHTAGRVPDRLLVGAELVVSGRWLSLYRTPGEVTVWPVGGIAGVMVVVDLVILGLVLVALLWWIAPRTYPRAVVRRE